MGLHFKRFAIAAAACLMLASCGQTTVSTPQEAPAASGAAANASAAAKPANVGDCVETTVSLVGPRLEGMPDSGSGIEYANGMSQVEYDVIAGIANSHVGDAVRLCLMSVPEHCPPGDDRGRVYSATNVRTGETWSAPDSQHMCGGA
jgi:hypothetical protein